AEIEVRNDGERFMKVGDRFVNIDEISINMIDAVNPFQRAYAILSKSVTVEVLGTIQNVIESKRIDMDIAEAVTLFKIHVKAYQQKYGKLPEITDPDPFVRRMAQAVAFITRKKQESFTQNS
ncbi:MAG: ATP-dependent helicase, partial [Rikenellaceae bacterium]